MISRNIDQSTSNINLHSLHFILGIKEQRRKKNDSSDQKKFLLIMPYGYIWKESLNKT